MSDISEKARKQANTRLFSFKELLETETNYRECLDNVCVHFLQSATLSKFEHTDYAKLFSNIESIRQLSKHFSDAMTPFNPVESDSCDSNASSPSPMHATTSSSTDGIAKSESPEQSPPSSPHRQLDWSCLGHALLAFFLDPQFAQQYKVFCADFTLVHERLELIKANDQELRQFIAKTERLPAFKGSDLETCLSRVFQRVPQYTMLMERIGENLTTLAPVVDTSSTCSSMSAGGGQASSSSFGYSSSCESTTDIAGLFGSVVKALHDIGVVINNYIKETEIKRKVDELKGKINGFDDELTKQGRHHILDVDMTQIKEKKKKGEKLFHVYLFNDIVLFTKPSKDAGKCANVKDFKPIFDKNSDLNVNFEDFPGEQGENLVSCMWGKQKKSENRSVFAMNNKLDKTKWLRMFAKAVEKAKTEVGETEPMPAASKKEKEKVDFYKRFIRKKEKKKLGEPENEGEALGLGALESPTRDATEKNKIENAQPTPKQPEIVLPIGTPNDATGEDVSDRVEHERDEGRLDSARKEKEERRKTKERRSSKLKASDNEKEKYRRTRERQDKKEKRDRVSKSRGEEENVETEVDGEKEERLDATSKTDSEATGTSSPPLESADQLPPETAMESSQPVVKSTLSEKKENIEELSKVQLEADARAEQERAEKERAELERLRQDELQAMELERQRIIEHESELDRQKREQEEANAKIEAERERLRRRELELELERKQLDVERIQQEFERAEIARLEEEQTKLQREQELEIERKRVEAEAAERKEQELEQLKREQEEANAKLEEERERLRQRELELEIERKRVEAEAAARLKQELEQLQCEQELEIERQRLEVERVRQEFERAEMARLEEEQEKTRFQREKELDIERRKLEEEREERERKEKEEDDERERKRFERELERIREENERKDQEIERANAEQEKLRREELAWENELRQKSMRRREAIEEAESEALRKDMERVRDELRQHAESLREGKIFEIPPNQNENYNTRFMIGTSIFVAFLVVGGVAIYSYYFGQ